jgi:glycosyltransferase involved in cell wall biosynthesis
MQPAGRRVDVSRQDVSLIVTVRNEEATIGELLDSMLHQTRRPDEVVINDCRCTDGTMAIVEPYRDRLPLCTTAGGNNIPEGRNTAIRAARGPLIACTDAGLWLDPHWLERIVAPLEQGDVELAAGFFQVDPRSPFERILGAINYYRGVEEVDPRKFLPSGRSMAFTRAAWETVGGFPEDLPYCEDLIFSRRLLQAGYRKCFVPDAVVFFRPRSSVPAFFRQYRNYAYGDGLANLWPRRHALRYGSYAAGLGLLAAGVYWPLLWLLLALGSLGYLWPFYRRLWPALPKLSPAWRIAAFFLVPLLRIVGDAAKMAGYLQGRWKAIRA